MRAGKLDRRISVLSPAVAYRSVDGQPVFTYATVLSGIWAERQPISGREFTKADSRWSETTTRFIIRYSSMIDSKCKILDLTDNIEYEIQAIVEMDNRQRGMEITAQIIGRSAAYVAPVTTGLEIVTEGGETIILEDGSTLVLEG